MPKIAIEIGVETIFEPFKVLEKKNILKYIYPLPGGRKLQK